MALRVESEESERLAREVARLTGESLDQAVTTSLRERLTRLQESARNDRDSDRLFAEIMAISAHSSRLPVLDPRHPDELLYDERGLPY